MQAQLIALDWGTSTLRAYRLGAGGKVLDSRASAHGIMHLPAPGGFDAAFEAACGDWLAEQRLPVIACGMVGSAQGWREAPYCPTPARAQDLSTHLQTLDTASGHRLHIVPGVIEHGALPNVMRGEETQVLGLLLGLDEQRRQGCLLVGLPGSHSKWVRVEGGCITHFDTFMTGELYAVASAHSILGRTQARDASFQEQAFDRGVRTALSESGALGPLSTAFSARTLGLTGVLDGAEQADYLSGLWIGHEVQALRQSSGAVPAVLLIGSQALCDRYTRALSLAGFPNPATATQATERGLWAVAEAAGLVKGTTQEFPHA
ncbi:MULTISPECIES: 2-dehydro-3-deoxygalactonokinase [unclassified Pseudomonas]|uniref:2-dehydro-3-deoxygalactonokinase n=1 Tax=unclassified Pseudomonas TaxID=196821 RepID=UPI000BDC67B3|nr:MULTISPECIES: 2-dehydro-3-deoxygalactonokinase [unclassified Pseudomonas]PVZ20320.1 2-dehydro-3-deoxygalactonokinase [Pseudomonas sp. URIL14HWK12:I12]PVZ27386.1 2-dehydro-3-deoxygalactonokinase [Pseudomonas sp. URIL14HWK12:I10]PVZ38275.1 2-dehydro-3-deoxygalactonokinase [Pseudomonas sp. URIL14HWK12:I11]SNZ04002.1 2-keto-3-deoxygalactonate kinase [Pseudomonas sp. URIL14HWK12:I9]